jgi:hypothetical protein
MIRKNTLPGMRSGSVFSFKFHAEFSVSVFKLQMTDGAVYQGE